MGGFYFFTLLSINAHLRGLGGQPNGKGTFQTPEGIMFTVNFESGLPHGKGVIQDLDGRMYSARWVRGVLKEKSIKPYKEKK